MTEIYMKNLTSTIHQFEGDISSDLDNIRKAAHKVIPSSRHMGFNQLAEQLKQLELNIINGIEYEIVKNQLKVILVDANEVLDQLKTFLESIKDKINQ